MTSSAAPPRSRGPDVAGALSVEIVSRYGGSVWEGTATQVTVPLVDGELGVLPGRQPILALIGRGTVRLTSESGQAVTVPVAGGFCSVDHDTVTVAADTAGEEALTQGHAPSSGLPGAAALSRSETQD